MLPADDRQVSTTHVLDRFLYDDKNIADRLYQGPIGYSLHRETTQTRTKTQTKTQTNHAQPSFEMPKTEHKRIASVRRLEREMDAVTDQQLLRVARRDQGSKIIPLFVVMVNINTMQTVTRGHLAWTKTSNETSMRTWTMLAANQVAQGVVRECHREYWYLVFKRYFHPPIGVEESWLRLRHEVV